MTRTMGLLAVVALVAIGIGIGAWYVWVREPTRDPIVRFAQPIPSDVESQARSAIAEFADAFAARRGCIPTAHVVLVRAVDGGDARYLAETAVIEIEIPTTPARFRESLVHELAHHVENTCPDFVELRDDWMTQSGDVTWSGQERWEDRPSEQWAEAVVGLVLGERLLHGDEMTLDPARVELTREWLES